MNFNLGVMKPKALLSFAMVVMLVGVYVAFSPGKAGSWQLDDRQNIVNLQNLQPDYLQSHSLFEGAKVNGQWGGRPLSRLSFALTVDTCGLTPVCFKVTNIALHGVTAILIYQLISLFLQLMPSQVNRPQSHIRWIALATAAFWSVHPIQVSTVLYAVQRMTILSAFFALSSIVCYLRWRISPQKTWALLWLLCVPAFAVLGFFSKENAVIIPLFILTIELFLLNKNNSVQTKKWINLGALVLVCVAMIIGFLKLNSNDFFMPFDNRHFSPYERLLTQSRILFHYLYWIVFPSPQHFTLFHDDISISKSLFQPLTTLFSLVSLLVVSALLWLYRKKIPVIAFAWFWFLVGHSVESSFLNLELVFEHRNYLPLVGPIFAFIYSVSYLQERFLSYAVIFCFCICITLISISYQKAYQWRSDGSMLIYEAHYHPKSIRLNYTLSILWSQIAEDPRLSSKEKQGYIALAENGMNKVVEIDTVNVHGYIGLLYFQGKQFIKPNVEVWGALHERLKTINYSPEITVLLNVLTNCALSGECVIDIDQLIKAYDIFIERNFQVRGMIGLNADKYRLNQKKIQLNEN